MYKLVVLPLLALGALGFSNEAEALIQIERCRSYTVTYPEQNGTFTTKTDSYCWLEFFAGPPEPPYQPPQIPDQPGGSTPAPNPPMCQSVLDNWPDDCSKEKKPVALPNGCSVVPASFVWVVNFTGACNEHDRCYGTFGSSKSSCDVALGDDMSTICNQYFGAQIHFEVLYGDIGNIPALVAARGVCRAQGSAYASGLSLVDPADYYDLAQKVAKCQNAHDDREQYCGS